MLMLYCPRVGHIRRCLVYYGNALIVGHIHTFGMELQTAIVQRAETIVHQFVYHTGVNNLWRTPEPEVALLAEVCSCQCLHTVEHSSYHGMISVGGDALVSVTEITAVERCAYGKAFYYLRR